MGVFHNFRIAGSDEHRVTLQFRAEAFNFINHNNPASINVAAHTGSVTTTNTATGVTTGPVQNSLFGNVNAWRDPRIMQIALKINY